MKNKKIILIVFFTLLFVIIGIKYNIDISKNEHFIYEGIINEVIYKNENSNNTISMMFETGLDTEEYVEADSSVWPGDDYAFNSELSRCENGGNLSYNYQTKKITLLNNISDKCYVYFDVYNKAKIDNVTSNVTTNSITVNVSLIVGDYPISQYYYSINNGSYASSSSNSYTFSGLSAGQSYSIRVYVRDTNGVDSNVYTINAETENVVYLADVCNNGNNLASCITSFYNSYGSDATKIYYHNSSLANSAGDNSYRYAGASDEVNNYVCFGSTASTCPSDNLYRIIGVFGNQVKLIKADYTTTTMTGSGGDYYGTFDWSTIHYYYKGSMSTSNIASYYWNRSNGSSSTNTWSQSRLNTTNLNSSYLSYIGTTWSNKIATTTWYVGGHSTEDATPATFQDAESTGTTYSAKIGLMYVSDYGFAATPSYWTTNMSSYRSARDNNWMYMGLDEWTISRDSSRSNYAFWVNCTGNLTYKTVYNTNITVRPVFYLTSSITYVSGSGSSADPIRLL